MEADTWGFFPAKGPNVQGCDGSVDDSSGGFYILNLLQRKRIADDVLRQRFPALLITACDLDTIVDIEP